MAETAAPRLFTRRHRYPDEGFGDSDSEEENSVLRPPYCLSDRGVDHQRRMDGPSSVYDGLPALSAAGSMELIYTRRHRYRSIDEMEDAEEGCSGCSQSTSRQGPLGRPFAYCNATNAGAAVRERVRPFATLADPHNDTRAVKVKVSAAVCLTATALAVHANNEHSLSAAPGPAARMPHA